MYIFAPALSVQPVRVMCVRAFAARGVAIFPRPSLLCDGIYDIHGMRNTMNVRQWIKSQNNDKYKRTCEANTMKAKP